MYKFALNSDQMHIIEEPLIHDKDTALNLMYTAGKQVSDEILKRFKPCKVLIICGYIVNNEEKF